MLVETKLNKQLVKVNPVLKITTNGLLHLEIAESSCKPDARKIKRNLPDSVLLLLKNELKPGTFPGPVTEKKK